MVVSSKPLHTPIINNNKLALIYIFNLMIEIFSLNFKNENNPFEWFSHR